MLRHRDSPSGLLVTRGEPGRPERPSAQMLSAQAHANLTTMPAPVSVRPSLDVYIGAEPGRGAGSV
jgi:hypothetical protein